METSTNTSTTTSAEIATAASDKVSEAVAYVIQTGDTLIGISRRQYGSDVRVDDICSLNKISDPDDIKVGQVIMLPQ
jgi:nucleoid-associated protein YgaU